MKFFAWLVLLSLSTLSACAAPRQVAEQMDPVPGLSTYTDMRTGHVRDVNPFSISTGS